MRELDEEDIRKLGRKYDVGIRETEAADLADRVTDILEGVDDVFDLPAREDRSAASATERHWERGSDRYNSIVTACHVAREEAGGPLDGVTIGLKDNIAVAGVPLTCGSAALRGHVADTDAPVVRRLIDSGAVIAAKTNLDEFASGGPWGQSSAYRGDIRNPADTDHVAGGSSGGSAAAVAGDLVDATLGSDTGGSIRIPAAFCGVVGLKPTNGLVPLTDVAETSRSLDTVGPITRSVSDAAVILEAIAGAHRGDPASVAATRDDDYAVGGYAEAVADPPAISELTVGVLTDGFEGGIQDQVREATDTAIDGVEDAGAAVTEVSIDAFGYGKAIKNVIRFFEGLSYVRDRGLFIRAEEGSSESFQSSLGARLDSMSHAFSKTFKAKILAGAELLEHDNGTHYKRAQAARRTLQAHFDEALADVDCLLTPTMPAVAPRIDSIGDSYGKAMTESGELGFDFAHNLRAINATGHPGITIPNGAAEGLPVGLQLIGSRFGECELLAAATRVESVVSE